MEPEYPDLSVEEATAFILTTLYERLEKNPRSGGALRGDEILCAWLDQGEPANPGDALRLAFQKLLNKNRVEVRPHSKRGGGRFLQKNGHASRVIFGDDGSWKAGGEAASWRLTEEARKSEFVPSTDYRVIRWRGRRYELSRYQAKIIQVMHKAHPDGMSGAMIMARANLRGRVRDILKTSPLHETLVTLNREGIYRLNFCAH